MAGHTERPEVALSEEDRSGAALERELYWASEREPGGRPQTAEGLRVALRDLEAELRRAERESVPSGEPNLAGGSRARRAVKVGQYRFLRPVTRRYDRLAADLAGLAAMLAERLAAAEGDVWRLQRALEAERKRAPGVSAEAEAPASEPAVPDAYYWAFEEQMRGSAESVERRLRQYERFAVDLRSRSEGETKPLWVDLGCGKGEFCGLLAEWGWRVHGVDTSPKAVETCRERGIKATLADALEFLRGYSGEPPLGMSAIQVIEHLPTGRWMEFFQRACGILAPGGGLLVETINALNPQSLTAHFYADVTHTWPGHPQTLRLMALHAGFESAEILYLNDDDRGSAQDFAIWAVAP